MVIFICSQLVEVWLPNIEIFAELLLQHLVAYASVLEPKCAIISR